MTHPIEWCIDTVNPFTGCTKGCSFCYARRMALWLGGMKGSVYKRLADAKLDPFTPAVHLDKFKQIRERLTRARKPRRVFVGSMSDIAHHGRWVVTTPQGVTSGPGSWPGWTGSELQFHVRGFLGEFPHHTFLMLTKRPADLMVDVWPDNVHLGVSVSTTADARRRVHILNQYGAGLKWASVEPLLDPDFEPRTLEGLDWVVVGAETGPGAMDPQKVNERAHRICEWCADNEIPCFVKRNMREADPAYPWPMELPTKE